jgi:potassium-transporting ATPase KdpC subunit
MSAPVSIAGRQTWAAVRAMLLATVVLGLLYPLVVTGIAQVVAPGRADGSLVRAGNQVVGSWLVGQAFTDGHGHPLARYFQPRPSAADYGGTASGGSNLGPDSPQLARLIEQRRADIAAFDRVPPDDVPPDAVTASASGLDPDISPEYAAIQVARVAEARKASPDAVRRLAQRFTSGPGLGFIGAARVNVLLLNLALDRELR